MSAWKPMESVINEIEFNFEQTVSIRTDVKLSKDDVKQIVSEAPAETLEEIAAKLKKDDLEVNRIENWDDEGNKV